VVETITLLDFFLKEFFWLPLRFKMYGCGWHIECTVFLQRPRFDTSTVAQKKSLNILDSKEEIGDVSPNSYS